MGSYSLSRSINNLTGGICKSYIASGFVRNPIIAGMVVTIITLLIVYYSKSRNLTRLFVLASLANITYLFFHTYALRTYIKTKGTNSNLLSEFTGICAADGIDEEIDFKPDSM
jgi:hypothetical protein